MLAGHGADACVSSVHVTQNAMGANRELRICIGHVTGLSLERREEETMAKLALVYGMRLFPAEDVAEVQEATLKLKDGRTARITLHLIEGSKEEIQDTLAQSVDAFFEMYPEI
jgi:hypothetical protein